MTPSSLVVWASHYGLQIRDPHFEARKFDRKVKRVKRGIDSESFALAPSAFLFGAPTSSELAKRTWGAAESFARRNIGEGFLIWIRPGSWTLTDAMHFLRVSMRACAHASRSGRFPSRRRSALCRRFLRSEWLGWSRSLEPNVDPNAKEGITAGALP